MIKTLIKTILKTNIHTYKCINNKKGNPKIKYNKTTIKVMDKRK